MLRAGDADFIDVGIDKVPELEKEKYRIFRHNGLSPLYAVFQLRQGDATQNINVRKAMAQAINRDELNRTLLNGLGEPTGNIWPGAGQPIPPTPYDLEGAKQTLAQASYGPGKPVTLTMQVAPAAGWPQMLPLAQAVQDAWKKIGVEATIVNRDFGAVRTEWLAGGLPAPAVVFMNFDPQVDWHSVVATVWTCNGLFKNVCDEKLDALHAEWGKATTMQDYIARGNAHERMMHDNYYVIPIVTSRLHFAGNDQLPEGYQPGNIVRGINVRAMVWNP
jgi:ABC-type transport system substrate-binding protein